MTSASIPLLEDDTIGFGEEDENNSQGNSLKHPYVTFFHLAFRSAALISYLLCGLFSNSFITTFVVIVILLSMDFWTVKNITGRLMVGLRWWNYVDDEGKSHWVFEAKQGKVNERESRIFWTALIAFPVVWSLFFLFAFFGLNIKWLLLITIALILSGANLYGYVKCKIGHKESISDATSNFFKKQVLQNAVSMVARNTTNTSQPNNTQTNNVNLI